MAKSGKHIVAAEVVDAIVPPTPSPDEDIRSTIPGYGEYEIDIEAVLRERLPVFFDGLDATPLTEDHIKAIPARAKGAYMLFRGNEVVPVYAGKTDSEHGFQDRLLRHAWTVKGRRGLDPADMRFKAVRIMVFAALDVEALLIRRMKVVVPNALAWNNSGFGSNDPGKRRDGQEPANFDQWFPIDYDFEIDGLPEGDVPIADLLRIIKEKLPFLLRYATPPAGLIVSKVPARTTLKAAMRSVMTVLPSGWQSTALHGRVILYPRREKYEFYQEMDRS